MEVIYEDNHLVAVGKTCSEIVQGDKTGDEPLSEKVKAYIKERYAKPGAVFIGVTHRLDRPVSGLVIFARTSKALARMNELFRTGGVQKIYWAVVKNRPPREADEITHWITRNEKLNKSFNSVNSYVCNRTQPNLETLLQISQILNVNMKDLIADQEQKQ